MKKKKKERRHSKIKCNEIKSLKVNGNRVRKLEKGELELLYLNVTLNYRNHSLTLSFSSESKGEMKNTRDN